MSGTVRDPVGTLWLVATPIGNLEDITLRAVRVLGAAAVVACEDTRTTRRVLERHAIVTQRLVSYHEHNEAKRAVELCEVLARGEDVALVSDAGMPLVSDPGARLVAAAIELGANVSPIPGASAVIAALAVSGLAGESFTFLGFPPVKGRGRRALLQAIVDSPRPVVIYESPHRVRKTVAELAQLAPHRQASASRELTKLHEETVRGTLGELVGSLAEREPRGEYTLVVAGAAEEHHAGDMETAVARARERMAAGGSLADAAREVAKEQGVARRELYALLLR